MISPLIRSCIRKQVDANAKNNKAGWRKYFADGKGPQVGLFPLRLLLFTSCCKNHNKRGYLNDLIQLMIEEGHSVAAKTFYHTSGNITFIRVPEG
ncbi:MAG: hypothetical protein ABIY51_11440 [Ferruginibacter sp.]